MAVSRISIVAGCLLVVSTAGLARAQGRSAPTIDALTRQAAVIVEGDVARITSAWNATRTQIHSTVTLNVRRYYKGGHGRPQLDFKVLGGSVGDITLLITHQPSVRRDEHVLLFLNPRYELGRFPFVAGENGKFVVETDPTTRRDTLVGHRMRVDKAAAEQDIARVNRGGGRP